MLSRNLNGLSSLPQHLPQQVSQKAEVLRCCPTPKHLYRAALTGGGDESGYARDYAKAAVL